MTEADNNSIVEQIKAASDGRVPPMHFGHVARDWYEKFARDVAAYQFPKLPWWTKFLPTWAFSLWFKWRWGRQPWIVPDVDEVTYGDAAEK